MAMTPEAKTKKAIKKVLDEFQCYYIMPVTGGYGKQGAPDFIVCVPPGGEFFGIEAKAGKGKTTALQELNLKQIRDAGGIAAVIYEDDIDVLRQILHEIQIG
jgi:ABC-type phosphonate transport system ATPase subunit